MGLYLTVPQSVTSRRAQGVFVFEGNAIVCLYPRKDKSDTIYFNDSGDNNYHYEKILEYSSDHKLDHIEIALPDILDDEQVEFVFEYLSNYLLDKEISIGLLVTSHFFINKYHESINFYGITTVGVEPPVYKLEKRFKAKASRPKRDYEGHALSFCLITSTPAPKNKAPRNKESIRLDESFHDKLIRLIIESNLDNKVIYKKAGITKQVFSKIISSPNMIPKKDTIICLILGLELPLFEGQDLLKSAGYTLSRSIMLDSVVMKYINHGIYDYNDINIELNERGCPLLGWKPREDN